MESRPTAALQESHAETRSQGLGLGWAWVSVFNPTPPAWLQPCHSGFSFVKYSLPSRLLVGLRWQERIGNHLHQGRLGHWRGSWLPTLKSGRSSLPFSNDEKVATAGVRVWLTVPLYPLCFSVASTFPRGWWASYPAGSNIWAFRHGRYWFLWTVFEQCWTFSCHFLGQGIGSCISPPDQIWQRTQETCLIKCSVFLSAIPKDSILSVFFWFLTVFPICQRHRNSDSGGVCDCHSVIKLSASNAWSLASTWTQQVTWHSPLPAQTFYISDIWVIIRFSPPLPLDRPSSP